MEKAYAQSPGEKYEYDQNTITTEGVGAEVIGLRPFEKCSLSLRFFACLIDQAILIIPSLIFAGVVASVGYFALAGSNFHIDFVRALCAGFAVSSFFAIHWLYFTLSESSSKKATFGMSILGLKVQKQRGERLSFFEANSRYWYWVTTSLFFGVNCLGFLGEEKEFFHDKISHTQVVVES